MVLPNDVASDLERTQRPFSVGGKIVVLTYDHPHRKTQDVVWRLISRGFWGDLEVIATPWVQRKERKYLYGHRPAERNWPCEPTNTPQELYALMGIPYTRSDRDTIYETLEALSPSVIVVGGAGILPKNVVQEFLVLNVHPGLLPARRGLDVLKWAIHDCKQVGVTAHLCDEHTDLGWLVLDSEVPVFPEDSFFTFAMRQYEYELRLLDDSVNMVLNNSKSARTRFERIRPGETQPFKRMPLEVEAGLLDDFERYKRVYTC